MLEGPVISPFGIGREAAPRKLPVFHMILDALAAKTVFRASAVGTTAPGAVLFFFAFHFVNFLHTRLGEVL